MNKITTIPFDGFYESHSMFHIESSVESSIEWMVEDGELSEDDSHNLDYDYSEAFTQYAECFVAEFESMLKNEYDLDISLKFESLDSPSAYNFTTDRIFAEITEDDIQKLYNLVMKDGLLDLNFAKYVEKKFSSYDGFISSYSNDLDDWGNVLEWDHNQIGAMLECLHEEYTQSNDDTPLWVWACQDFCAMDYVKVTMNGEEF